MQLDILTPEHKVFSGNVYGVDTEKFFANPSTKNLLATQNAQRTKRGRVTTAGSKDIVVGRWRWLNMVVAPADAVDKFIEYRKKMVGQARGGWAAGYNAFGGRISERGWVGRHMSAGSIIGWPPSARGIINCVIVNNSAWASNGDPDRIIDNALQGRQRDIERSIEVILTKRWGLGAASFDKTTGKTTL